MIIKKTLLSPKRLKPIFQDISKLQFGNTFTDYMFTMEYDEEHGWHNGEIKPYQPLVLDPATSVFHYGQAVFEGQKAYKSQDDRVLLFRPWENARRFNNSLKRMCMPEIPEKIFIEVQSELVCLENRWISKEKGASLYIRAAVIASQVTVKLKPSDNYIFFIILSPSPSYFQELFRSINLWVSDFYIRAAVGGTGEAKTSGNYAAGMLALDIAKKNNCDQVLWLDSREKKYIEEVGAMNVFFVIKGKLVTPKLNGSILAGVTRNSVLQLANDLGVEVEERSITIAEVVSGIQSGAVTEIFCSGTAVSIVPVKALRYEECDYVIQGEASSSLAKKLYDILLNIQHGIISDPYGWMLEISTDHTWLSP